MNRTAAKVYAHEVVELVYDLDKEGKMPKIVVASEQLAKVTLVKGALKPSDVAPINARMEDLENIVKKLADSFDNFKKDAEKNTRPTFANIAGAGGAAGLAAQAAGPGSGEPGHGQGVPTIEVGGHGGGRGQGHGRQNGRKGNTAGRNTLLSVNNDRERDLSPASKRAREEELQDTGNNGNTVNNGYTTVPPRRNRKTNFGKSTVTLDGVDAAPVEIFVGNTNPRATEEKG